MGIKEMLELIAAVRELALAGKMIMKDGKIGVADLAVLSGLLEKQQMLVAGFLGLGELKAEAKDLQVAEAMQVIEALLQAAKDVKDA